MQLLRHRHEFEYRDHRGVDQQGVVDVWVSAAGDRAVLVLRGLPGGGDQAQADKALLTLSYTCLPYLLRPDTRLGVFVLRPREDEATKARALVLALSA